MDEASRCDRLLLLRDGRIVFTGTPDELLQAPAPTISKLRSSRSRRRRVTPALALATAERRPPPAAPRPRTLVLCWSCPPCCSTLFRYVFNGQPETFDRVGGPMVGIFPFISMFLVTSIAMLRERTTGALERLMSMPIGKLDLLLGYGISFALVAAVQATIASFVAFGLLGSTPRAPRPGGRDRNRERPARDGTRPVPERLRADGVPGRSVHAGLRAAADPARGASRPARPDGRAARVAVARAATHLCVRRARAGDGYGSDRRQAMAQPRRRHLLHRPRTRPRRRDTPAPNPLE